MITWLKSLFLKVPMLATRGPKIPFFFVIFGFPQLYSSSQTRWTPCIIHQNYCLRTMLATLYILVPKVKNFSTSRPKNNHFWFSTSIFLDAPHAPHAPHVLYIKLIIWVPWNQIWKVWFQKFQCWPPGGQKIIIFGFPQLYFSSNSTHRLDGPHVYISKLPSECHNTKSEKFGSKSTNCGHQGPKTTIFGFPQL